jgi:hypothetical protein
VSATSDILVSREGTTVVRERTFLPSDFARVMQLILEERLSGQVILDCNLGGVRNVRIIEQQKLEVSP